jgi:hypothetical protein
MAETKQASRKKKKKLEQLRKRLVARCKNLLQPIAIQVLQEDNTNYQSAHHLQQGNQTTTDSVVSESRVEGSQDDDEDSDDDGWAHPRCDFETIGAILDSQFVEIVRSNCIFEGALDAPRVTGRCYGTYNYIAFVDLPHGGNLKQYVVRVPGHATIAHWRPEDSYILLREVDMLNNVRNNTTVPVPEIIGFATDHNNALGFPYILMTKLSGQPAYDIWFDEKPYREVSSQVMYTMADVPTIATERKRITFLRSLARAMTELQTFKTEQIGMLQIDASKGNSQSIGPTYHWTADGGDDPTVQEPATSTQIYARTVLDAIKPKKVHPDMDVWMRAMGGYRILEMVFRQSVFNAVEKESFTIHHNDLDLQNILVDDDGNVTGIIDWDHSYMATFVTPRTWLGTRNATAKSTQPPWSKLAITLTRSTR